MTNKKPSENFRSGQKLMVHCPEGEAECRVCGCNFEETRRLQAKQIFGTVYAAPKSNRNAILIFYEKPGDEWWQSYCTEHLHPVYQLHDIEPFKSLRLKYDGNLFGERDREVRQPK